MHSFPYHPSRVERLKLHGFALGKEFVEQGHEVKHISRLDHGLKNAEVVNGVNHQRIRGANAVKNPYLLKNF